MLRMIDIYVYRDGARPVYIRSCITFRNTWKALKMFLNTKTGKTYGQPKLWQKGKKDCVLCQTTGLVIMAKYNEIYDKLL